MAKEMKNYRVVFSRKENGDKQFVVIAGDAYKVQAVSERAAKRQVRNLLNERFRYMEDTVRVEVAFEVD